MNQQQVTNDIGTLKNFWQSRNKRFGELYEILILIDKLYTKGMESYCSNEPQTFYNMAHYLLTKGELLHMSQVESESPLELDRREKLHRACDYEWWRVNRDRRFGGSQEYVDELGFWMLALGWYAGMSWVNPETGRLVPGLWNPNDVFPRYADGKLTACVHSYKMLASEIPMKAQELGWTMPPGWTSTGRHESTIENYFKLENGIYHSMVLVDGHDVSGWESREDILLFASPVGGFPDEGSLANNKHDYKKRVGRSIFEVNDAVYTAFNKWKSEVSQILRDTAQSMTQEFSATQQATPENLRQRGAHFHFAPSDRGIERIPPATIPIEIQAHLLEMRREIQKGSFTDAVYGMMEGQPGYSLSLMATASANQILYPYMESKHFVIGENDRFFLSAIKKQGKSYHIGGLVAEELKSKEIPDEVVIKVESEVATPKDWLERGTVANMLEKHLDEDTIIAEILHKRPQAIKRKRAVDRMRNHPIFQSIELIAAARNYANYLRFKGDPVTAKTFLLAANALEQQMAAPAPGQGKPTEQAGIEAARKAGAPEERTRVLSRVMPPEARSALTPSQLRQQVGRGKVIAGR